MKRNVSSSSHRDDKITIKVSRSEDSRGDEERLRRRREWMIQQERDREHERLKKKMILEYEIRRAREKGLPVSKGRLTQRSRSRSPETQHRRSTTANAPKVAMMSEKLKSSDGTTPLFKGPEGTQISATELRRIKVDIHRNIPGQTVAGDLQREILNPEDVVLKRRAGEGSKPIFEREEIKGIGGKLEEIEEHRTVVAVNNENLDTKSKACSKYTSPIRTRSNSPRHASPTYSRYESSTHHSRDTYRSNRKRDPSRNKSKEYKDGDRRHRESHDVADHSRDRNCHRDHSRSSVTELTKSDRDSHHRAFKDGRSYREYRDRSRGRSRDRSRERRERDRSRERRLPPAHYIEQIPVPIYCGNFPPRPIMVGPLVPIRGQVPLGGGRHLPMMGPIRPFPPRFLPQDMYRLRPGLNPRFGPMY